MASLNLIIYNVESVAATTIRPIGWTTTYASPAEHDADEPADAANEHGQPHDGDGLDESNDDANDGQPGNVQSI